MFLTERDVEIMKFINEFGFCEILQIGKRFEIKKSRCYEIMKRLVDNGYIIHERIFYGSHGIFFLTSKGAGFTDLPPMKTIPKDNYHHQLSVIELYLKLREQNPTIEWMTERRIKRDKYADTQGSGWPKKKVHIPDGSLTHPEGKQIAIEVELTMKSKRRLTEILRSYLRCFDYREIWYFCAPEIVDRVHAIATQVKIPHIKIHHL